MKGKRMSTKVTGKKTSRRTTAAQLVQRQMRAARETDTSALAMRRRAGARSLTPQEWQQFLDEHGPDMLPPDGEG
jgi:hypothetical protein